ncbi:peptide ABC transporter substrate-binding protein [Elioraea sp. Yellowstone]|uniref:peptide ABC transporter substrate-binding protein n=1 Tax=Elioraea sp. Yellowstone TaxID=2592070 RepID=UPI0011502733|nr:peptide ABC transporter substrate-binding protein [Elioraea sp. Yellowstone]TQF79258.1 peptide ABC transporter substrate-binding protein [Elioraea sp. Yellowstone]
MALRRILIALALLALPAAAQPRDQLTIGLTQYPSTLHPSIESMAAKSYVHGFTLRPITTYDADWQLACMLCTHLPTIENGEAVRETAPNGNPGIRVTYRLREDARWGDGTPITAEDILFAWQAGREPLTGMGPAELYRSLHRITVVDPRTVTLHFDKLTFEYNAINDLRPLPAHLERAIWQEDPRGYRTRTLYDRDPARPGLWSGPYRVATLNTGASVTLERNEQWWGAAPAFRRIVIRTIENTTALEAALLAGQIDMIAGELGLTLDQAIALERRAGSRFRIHYQPGLIYEHIDLNLDNPVLADPRVREALLRGIDRQQIVDRLFAGRQPVAHSFVNPLDWMHDPTLPTTPFDPDGARRLLEQAGWRPGPDGIRRNAAGERLSLELMTTAGNRSRELVQQVLQGMWRQIGVEIRLRNEPPRVFFGETVSKRRFQAMAMFAWISSPENVPRTTLHSTEIPTEDRNWSGQNYTGFKNAEMDELIEALPLTLDREERRPMWRRVQEIYMTERPVLPLFFRSDAHIWPRWLEGVRPTGHLAPSSLWVEQWKATQ